MISSIQHKVLYVILAAMVALAGCGDTDYLDLADAELPSAGLNPEGNDILSTFTNHSAKDGDLSPDVSGLAGAAFIKAPQINHFGTVSLAYPIDVPAGRAGMQPQVGLSYSSSGGDGLVGIGWNLGTGLGVISRTTRNGQLYYDARDEFTYNGQRLIKVAGSSGEDGEYRLEIESNFLRFELSDSANGGVWHVFDMNGALTVYGEDISARVYQPADNKKTYSWYYSKSTDLNGNFMAAVYDTSSWSDDHILYLKEIRYTGNADEGQPARQYVRFHLKERDEAYVSKAPGFIMRMEKMLDWIEVGWDDPLGSEDTELWRYTMVYETSEDSNRQLLKTVRSTRTATEPEFMYQPATHYFTWRVVENVFSDDTEIDPESTKYFEGDFNGDGISDMVFFNPVNGEWKAAEGRRDGGYVFKSYGNRFQGFDSPSKIQFFKGNVTGDYNGDGRSDIAFYLPETREFYVAEHDGRVFQFRRYGGLTLADVDIFRCEWFPGDFDGNGLSDSVLFDEATGKWILMRNLGGSFEFTVFSRHFQNLFRGDYAPDGNLDSASTQDASPYGRAREKVHFLSGDYNGDGRTDISIYDARDGKWWVAENYRVPSPPSPLPGGEGGVAFNLEWKLYKVFTAPEQALFGFDRFSGDFNGDGFSDFLVFDRAGGYWWLGETAVDGQGSGTINFRKYARTPEHREITRWLQGDFNGDGRTDIGFYSATDGNFWIGEATPDGFRYRIYNNMSYGPDRDVMATPLPVDEVKVEGGSIITAAGGQTFKTDYKFDGNYHTDRGEMPFVGFFTGSGPELLIYKRENDSFFVNTTESPSVISGIDLGAPNIKLLNNERPGRFTAKDGLLYYEKTENVIGSDKHEFKLIHYESSFRTTVMASFDDINNFDVMGSLWLVDRFTAGSDAKVLVLDDQRLLEGAAFYLYDGSNKTELSPEIDGLSTEYFNDIFSADKGSGDREKRKSFQFFSGKFTDESAQILMIDMTGEGHEWYLGDIDVSDINFTLLDHSTDASFVSTGYKGYHVVKGDGGIVYSTEADGRVRFHVITVEEGVTPSVSQTHYSELEEGTSFKGEFDHEGNPIVHTASGLKKAVLGGSQTLADITPQAVTIARSDLYKKVYPFNWIQGDYNGDGKTDIGIFHLKERNWYFANTVGTVPDLIHRMKNGIGGSYEFEYINSTTLDNTGADGIPHLPMNYKVCSKMTVDDGRGGRVSNKYGYAKGYAFSAFVNGKKETDYFGFGQFTVTDALGGKTVSYYHNVPYDDFRKNRALAGALKETRVIGSDLKEYARSLYEYELHEIPSPLSPLPGGEGDVRSYLIDPKSVVKYARNHATGNLVLVETREVATVLVPDAYVMKNRTSRVTDHYKDGVHDEATVENYSEYEYDEATNELRVSFKKDMTNSQNEVTASYSYDGKGNLVRETTSYTGAGLEKPADRVIEHAYDGFGNRVKSTDASGAPSRVSEKVFDARLHQFVKEERRTGDSITLSVKYTLNYETAFGAPAKKTDENNNSSYYEYDGFGRLLRARADTDAGEATTATYSYSTVYPLSAKAVRPTGTGDPDIETRIFYDGLGRVIHKVQSATTAAGKRYVKSGKTVFDALGRVIRQGQPDWADDGEIDSYRDHTGERNPTVTEYDGIGRVRKVTYPQAAQNEPEVSVVTSYNDPWETVESMSGGRSKTVTKNARGQVLYVKDAGKGDDGQTVDAKMGFAYDLAGRRVKRMDLNGAAMSLDLTPRPPLPGGEGGSGRDTSGNNVSYWWYDGFGRVITQSDPDRGCAWFSYTSFGEAATQTDGRGRTTSFVYDRLGRMTVKTLPDSEGQVSYTYDALSGSENALGRLAAIDDPAQRKELSYDRLGRVKREVRRFHELGANLAEFDKDYETILEHDLLGRKMRVTYPADPKSGERAVATTHFNSMGVTSVAMYYKGVNTGIVQSAAYNEFGRRLSVTNGNGVTTNYDYDARQRLTDIISATNANNQDTSLLNLHYTLNIQDSISAVDNTPDMGPENIAKSTMRFDYRYDGLNRLVHAAGSYERDNTSELPKKFEQAFAYAQNGNLSRKDILNPDSHSVNDRWTYTYTNHAVTGIDATLQAGRFVMEYDANGNMTRHADNGEGRSKQMTYDSTNRIRTVKDEGSGDTVGTYYYDDGGFRVRRISKRDVDGKKYEHEILYTSMYMGLEIQKDTRGNVVTNSYAAVNNIYLNGLRIATIIPSGEVTYYLTDQVDSVKVVVNAQGLPVSRTEFHPYGETWFQEGSDNFAPKFNSQELDKESGLYFYNARYYDAEVGRFVTADNVVPDEGDTQSWNRYSYVNNNPIALKDPSGNYDLDAVVPKNRSNTGTITLKDDYGNVIKSYPVLTQGTDHEVNDMDSKNRMKRRADTPTGKYEITGKYSIPESNETSRRRFGPHGFNLSGVEGEAAKSSNSKGNSGINVHGGSEYSSKRKGASEADANPRLRPTWGCLRMSDADVTDLYKKVGEIEKQRDPRIKVFRDIQIDVLKRISNKNGKDYVNVEEK